MSTDQRVETAVETIQWIKGDITGAGTSAKVWLALNVKNGEMIAVKQYDLIVPSPELAQKQKDRMNAIKAQLSVLCGLQHPNIDQLLGYEETTINLNVFFEYIPGGSIRSVINKDVSFSEDVMKSFTGQILCGLEYLHWRGIWHGDVHTDHILVDSMGICKLSSIGTRDVTSDVTVESLGQDASSIQDAIGFWLAPEVLSDGKQGQSEKTDIWALGCVLVEMFTRRRPWPDDDARAIVTKVSKTSNSPQISQLEGAGQAFVSLFFERNAAQRSTAIALRTHPFLKLPPEWQFTSFS